jgi:phosphodiesterase/alkaline phosphatase D-like protein
VGGYPFDRQAVLDFISTRGLTNTVVITGDVHQNLVRNVPPDYVRLDADSIATEFIGTSISSGGDRTVATVVGGHANNRHLRFSDNQHGYVRCAVTPICGAPTTASCHRSRCPTMAASERSRRLSSSRHDQGPSQPRDPVHHEHCRGGGKVPARKAAGTLSRRLQNTSTNRVEF